MQFKKLYSRGKNSKNTSASRRAAILLPLIAATVVLSYSLTAAISNSNLEPTFQSKLAARSPMSGAAKTPKIATTTPVRVVLLLPSDGNDTSKLGVAESIGSHAHNWYCMQVGSCYTYQGVSVMRGGQTQAYYMTCHDQCQDPTILHQIYANILAKDAGTVSRDDVITQVIPAWDTKSWPTDKICGSGGTGKNLDVIDAYSIATVQNHHGCIPLWTGAHELGHNFGLTHTGNGTLMDPSPTCTIVPDAVLSDTCTLDPTQRITLQHTSRIFPSPSVPHS